MATVRRERPEDRAAVQAVNELAFGRAAEADLVDALRTRGQATVSLVAVDAHEVVGHILFSPVTIQPAGEPARAPGAETVAALGLGPMAVLPARQRHGIGSLLVRRGLEACRDAGHGCVVVLGHPEYYPRFGFAPASRHGVIWEHPAPDEAFMLLELRAGALGGRGGVVRYQPEFGEV
jgi:putative acetyltransferase